MSDTDWRTRLAEPLRVDLSRLRSIAEGLRSLGEREVLSSGAAHEVAEDILDAIGESEGVDES